MLFRFYRPEVINTEKFKFDDAGNYYVPPDGSYDSYVDYVRDLPYAAHPSVFGMHPNVDISKDQVCLLPQPIALFLAIVMTMHVERKSVVMSGSLILNRSSIIISI